MRIKPLSDNYLLKEVKQEKKTGILIVPDSKDCQMFYEVVSNSDSNEIAIGSKVVVIKHRGQEIVIDNQNYLMVRLADIIGIVEE